MKLKFVLPFLLAFMVSCDPFENNINSTYEADPEVGTTLPDNFDFERAKLLNKQYAQQYAQEYVRSNKRVQAISYQGVLRLTPALNARIVRAQVIHTRNGYHPAFDVSGVEGVGVENGFQWINFGKNSSAIYNAGQPLSAFPKGKLGGAVWLISGDKNPPFAADGNMVVSE